MCDRYHHQCHHNLPHHRHLSLMMQIQWSKCVGWKLLEHEHILTISIIDNQCVIAIIELSM